jgi:signal transduction histidine kinase
MDPATDPGRGDRLGGATLTREILRSLPAAVAYVTWPGLVFRFANDGYRQIAGDVDLIGRSLREAEPDLPAGRLRLIQRAALSGQRLTERGSEVLIKRPGESPEHRFADFTCQPVRDNKAPDEGGGVTGLLLYADDVTTYVRDLRRLELLARRGHKGPERITADTAGNANRRAQERLVFLKRVRANTNKLIAAERRRRELEVQLRIAERQQTVGQLASGIAHDFANLLAIVAGYTEMAEDTIDDGNPELRRILEEINQAADRAVHLSNDLVHFSGRVRARPEEVNLNVMVVAMMKLLIVSLGNKIAVILSLSPTELPKVIADVGQLEQVLVNLVVNARDAMPEGGTLTISTATADFDEEHSRMHRDATPGRYVELAVRDTGVGMSAEVKDKIFDRFFSTKGAAEGTGLGLNTVRGIVSELGGTIAVDSAEGQGTAFHVYLPAIGGANGSPGR